MTEEEQAEWVQVCADAGEDFSAVVRGAIKRLAGKVKREAKGGKT